MSIADLPANVRGYFPKENLEFAAIISKEESEVLKEVFLQHDCFERVGEMIETVTEKSPPLGQKMSTVLQCNCSRLQGLSETAVDYSKRVIHFVTHVMCHLTLGKTQCFKMADELHDEFLKLSPADQEALKKNNADITF